jgi:hypothetical protein
LGAVVADGATVFEIFAGVGVLPNVRCRAAKRKTCARAELFRFLTRSGLWL